MPQESFIEGRRKSGIAVTGPEMTKANQKAVMGLAKADRERAKVAAPTKEEKKTVQGILKERKDKTESALPKSYSKGGMVKKTGMAKVHAGEKVLTKAQVKKVKKHSMRKAA